MTSVFDEDFVNWDGNSMDSSDNAAPVGDPALSDEEYNLKQEMARLAEMMEEMNSSIEQFNIKRQGIGVTIQQIDEQRKALVSADREIQNRSFEISREIRRLEMEAAQKQRLLEQQAEQRRLKEEYARLTDEYDRKTANAFWRKDAMHHQIDGGKKMAVAKTALLGDKRGLGKTLTSLIAADMIGAKRILYISPGDVIRTVEREIQHWTPHREVAPLGMMPKAQRKFAIKMLKQHDSFIVTVNFEAWRRDASLKTDLISLQFDMIIIDEAHNIKDTSSVGYKGVEQIAFAQNSCPTCRESKTPHSVTMEQSKDYSWIQVPTCSNGHQAGKSEENYDWCSAQNIFPMTGTPILNRPQDLFALLSLIDRPRFYNLNEFLRDYCTQDLYSGRWKFRSGGLESLIKKLEGRVIIRDRHQAGIVIPEQTPIEYDLEMTEEEYPEQRRLSKMLNEHAALQLANGEVKNILAMIALITRKRQMMTWPEGIKWPILDERGEPIPGQYFTVDCMESIKIDKCIRLKDGEWDGLIPELTADGNWDEGERVVLFSQFKPPLIELEKRCKQAGISVVRYDGDTPKNIQDEVVIDFDAKYCNEPGYEKKWQVVLANYKKGGVGLNLTDATQMIILDEEWNPGKVDQAYGRIDRIGQTKETTVHVLRVQKSVDTWMAGIIAEKAEMIEGFETQQSLAQDMLDKIRSGEMI
jgi:SNF2 family DNA or RNA helicase